MGLLSIKGFGDGPKSKPLIKIVKPLLVDARAAGTIELSDQALFSVMEKIEARPMTEQPKSFRCLPSPYAEWIGLGTFFNGSAVQDVLAASTIGNVTKDTVVSILMQKSLDEQ